MTNNNGLSHTKCKHKFEQTINHTESEHQYYPHNIYNVRSVHAQKIT